MPLKNYGKKKHRSFPYRDSLTETEKTQCFLMRISKTNFHLILFKKKPEYD